MIGIFNGFVNEYGSQNKASSIIKTKQILSSTSPRVIWICLKDGPFETDIGNVNLHPTKRTPWVAYNN